jgi:hypothetical protein
MSNQQIAEKALNLTVAEIGEYLGGLTESQKSIVLALMLKAYHEQSLGAKASA